MAAADEPLLEITAVDAEQLARLAWHIGNRHLPAQMATGRILIREDSVIEDMLKGLGAAVRHVAEPFMPEPGAYDQQPFPAARASESPGSPPWMTRDRSSATQFQLLAWCSGSYPHRRVQLQPWHGVGGRTRHGDYTFQFGGLHRRERDTRRWLVDAVLFAHAWRAARQSAAIWERGGSAQLLEITELAAAFRATSETALESRQQGAAFLAVTIKAWPHPRLEQFVAELRGQRLPIALQWLSRAPLMASTLSASLHAYVQAGATNRCLREPG